MKTRTLIISFLLGLFFASCASSASGYKKPKKKKKKKCDCPSWTYQNQTLKNTPEFLSV
jgi:hypothetical protein